jgi:hypothetical protein
VSDFSVPQFDLDTLAFREIIDFDAIQRVRAEEGFVSPLSQDETRAELA